MDRSFVGKNFAEQKHYSADPEAGACPKQG
jgi:hypothetical protein